MHQNPYLFDVSGQSLRFDFVSTGKRIVPKTVIYTKTDTYNFYLLSLLNVYPNGTLDDKSVSDNGGMEKILLTVFHTFTVFFQAHPNALVAFEGSTPSRTRLYRMALSHELVNIRQLYNVGGITEAGVEPFQDDRPYVGFLLSLKGTNIA